jgi:hypothetical protein
MTDFLTLSQVSREFGISKSTLHRWVNIKKVIPASQPIPGGNKYVKRSDVAALLTGEWNVEKPKRRKSILFPRG